MTTESGGGVPSSSMTFPERKIGLGMSGVVGCWLGDGRLPGMGEGVVGTFGEGVVGVGALGAGAAPPPPGEV